MDTMKAFLDKFLVPPKGDSAEAVKARIRWWIDVANSPGDHTEGDTSPYALSARRRTARQNLRRIGKRYPDLLAQVKRDSEVQP